MKKYIGLFFILLCFGYSIRGSHLMGGEIVVQNDQVGNHEILLTLYRDITGIALPNTQTLNVFDSGGNIVSTIISNLDSTAHHPVFGIPNGSLLPNNFYSTEIYFYSAFFPCFIPGNYTVSWDNCCRNPSVINMINPGSLSMYLECNFTVDLTSSTSSPYFLSPPIVCVPLNTPWQYNPLPFDSEGDSLHWTLGIPFEYVPGNFPNGYPIAGYSTPPSSIGGGLSINSFTGEISWTASTIGNYVYTVICEEYRNGIKLGEIRRDMQFIVIPNGNLPLISNLNNFSTNQNGIPYFESMVNNSLDLELYVLDSSSFFLSFDGIGETFDDSLNPMTFSISSTNNPYEKRITLNWIPSINNIRSTPYVITTRLFNGTFSMDYTFFIYVTENTTTIKEINNDVFKVYPNPNSGCFIKQISIEQTQQFHFIISDINGKVRDEKNIFLNHGLSDVNFETCLPSGIYLLTTKKNNRTVSIEKIFIQ